MTTYEIAIQLKDLVNQLINQLEPPVANNPTWQPIAMAEAQGMTIEALQALALQKQTLTGVEALGISVFPGEPEYLEYLIMFVTTP